MQQRYDLLAMSLMLFSVALITASGIAGPFVSDTVSNSIYFVFKDWQTLVTGGLAVVAAFIAAHPVRKQLSKMNIQSSIMALEVIANRLKTLESRELKTVAALNKVSNRLAYDMHFDDEISSNPHWAFERERDVDEAIRGLRDDQDSKIDSESVDTVREKVIMSATELGGAYLQFTLQQVG